MSTACYIKHVVKHILQNPSYYPGIHNTSQPRTSRGCPILDPERQLLLIWDATASFLRENLLEGRAVHFPKFGTFTFLIPGLDAGAPNRSVKRPIFYPSPELQTSLIRSKGKNVSKSATAYSGSQRTVFLNSVPLAAGTYFHKDLVKSGLSAIFQGVIDLIDRDYNVTLNLGCVRLKIHDRTLISKFDRDIIQWIAPEKTEDEKNNPMRRTQSLPKLSDTWKMPVFSKSMMNFMERPRSKEYSRKKLSTNTLGILSLDLNSFAGMKRTVS